jgi:hypothetical protein
MATIRKSEARESRQEKEPRRLREPRRSPYAKWLEARSLRAERRRIKDEKRRFRVWLKKILEIEGGEPLDIERFLAVEDTSQALAA